MKKTLPLLLMAMACVAGCGTFGEKKTDEEIVAKKGQEWIEALVKNDFEKAWSYTSPAFRSANTVAAYKRRVGGALNWTDGRFESVTCEESRCEAKFYIDYTLPRYNISNTRLIDNVWIKVDGKWWLYQK